MTDYDDGDPDFQALHEARQRAASAPSPAQAALEETALDAAGLPWTVEREALYQSVCQAAGIFSLPEYQEEGDLKALIFWWLITQPPAAWIRPRIIQDPEHGPLRLPALISDRSLMLERILLDASAAFPFGMRDRAQRLAALNDQRLTAMALHNAAAAEAEPDALDPAADAAPGKLPRRPGSPSSGSSAAGPAHPSADLSVPPGDSPAPSSSFPSSASMISSMPDKFSPDRSPSGPPTEQSGSEESAPSLRYSETEAWLDRRSAEIAAAAVTLGELNEPAAPAPVRKPYPRFAIPEPEGRDDEEPDWP